MHVFVRGRAAAMAAVALTVSGTVSATVAGTVALAPAAHAQAKPGEAAEQRLRRMEAEIRALQRKVFPEGAGRTFGPEIVPPATSPTAPAGTPATTAVSDMLVRMDSLEGQLTRLTAQVEETQNRLTRIEAQLAATPSAASSASTSETPAMVSGTALVSNAAAMGASVTPKPAAPQAVAPAVKQSPKPPVAEPSADRVSAVQAIEKPQTGDRAEDEYSYGFRLWEAKFYPEAQQQLQRFVQQYPRHRRISFARNLLGRAYLDDGKPGTAAQYFVENYQADPGGDRAADSLLYLAVAMTRLKETKRACVALDELSEKFASATTGRLAGDYRRARAAVKCN